MNVIMQTSLDYVSIWYQHNYPEDPFGKDINQLLTFTAFWKYVQMGVSPEYLLGVGDSVVESRVFGEIAKRIGGRYDITDEVRWNSRVNFDPDDYVPTPMEYQKVLEEHGVDSSSYFDGPNKKFIELTKRKYQK